MFGRTLCTAWFQLMGLKFEMFIIRYWYSHHHTASLLGVLIVRALYNVVSFIVLLQNCFTAPRTRGCGIRNRSGNIVVSL